MLEKEIPENLESFDEFWPYYVREHQNGANQVLHFMATSYEIALIVLGFAVSFWFWAFLPLGYIFAWVGHFVFEKNKPATFKYVRWSYRGDHIMFFYLLTGRWKSEIEKMRQIAAV